MKSVKLLPLTLIYVDLLLFISFLSVFFNGIPIEHVLRVSRFKHLNSTKLACGIERAK